MDRLKFWDMLHSLLESDSLSLQQDCHFEYHANQTPLLVYLYNLQRLTDKVNIKTSLEDKHLI